MNTATKNFSSTQPGSLVLTGQAGSLAAILKACLQDGFGSTNVVTLAVAAGVATATYASGHPFLVNTVGLFAGATTLTGLNGEKRILSTTANAVTFDATGVADGTAAGTITSKVPSLGWTQAFSKTNVPVFKPLDPMATGCLLRVDDTGTTNARVQAYESMTDVDTGSGLFPRSEQIAGGGFWNKSASADTVARPWSIVGDGRAFYLCVASGSAPNQSTVWFFGDLDTTKSGDAYGCVLFTSATDISNLAGAVACMGYSQKTTTTGYLPRAANALGSATNSIRIGTMHYGNVDSYSGYTSYAPALSYPNAADNGLILCKVAAIDNQSLRGTYPGLLHIPQSNAQDAFATRTFVPGSGDLYGRTLMAMRVGAPSSLSAGTYGVVFFDINNDWR